MTVAAQALTLPPNINSTGGYANAPDEPQSQLYDRTIPVNLDDGNTIPTFGVETSSANTFLPATSVPIGDLIDAWDPWTHADLAKMFDHSMPASGADNYGESSGLGNAGSIVATWGGMPYPLLDYNDERPMVAIVPRSGPYPASGPAGSYYGQAQAASAVEQAAQTAINDPWSVLLGVG